MYKDMETKTFGEASTKIYNDWDDLGEVTSIPDYAPHRDVDMIVLAAAAESGSNVKTAIVTPPTIYGNGRGPDNQRSLQVPELCRITLTLQKGISRRRQGVLEQCPYPRSIRALFSVGRGCRCRWWERNLGCRRVLICGER
jgi:hypothetical protein